MFGAVESFTNALFHPKSLTNGSSSLISNGTNQLIPIINLLPG